jgi:hypothetical protein
MTRRGLTALAIPIALLGVAVALGWIASATDSTAIRMASVAVASAALVTLVVIIILSNVKLWL